MEGKKMGCDIHMLVEFDTGDEWVTINTLSYHTSRNGTSFPLATSRNYKRFAALAGVRGDGPGAKGMPDNLSNTAKWLQEKWAEDGHSHSYMSLDEALPIFVETQYWDADVNNAFGKEYPACYFFGIEDEENYSKYRIVFLFDC